MRSEQEYADLWGILHRAKASVLCQAHDSTLDGKWMMQLFSCGWLQYTIAAMLFHLSEEQYQYSLMLL